MKELNVYFIENPYANGTACLIENLITEDIRLEISGKLYIDEIKTFIDKAVKKLEIRYEKINVNINWDYIQKKESDK